MKLSKLFLALGGTCMFGGLLLTSCADKKSRQVVGSGQTSANKQLAEDRQASPELNFLRTKRYKYVTRVAAIPAAALVAMEGHSQLCDTASGIPINLSDVHITGLKECTRKLNFALVGDTCCLIVYRQGGRGVHDVIYYAHYRGKYSFTTNDALDYLDDTVQLARFLQKQPPVEKVYSDKIAPPPPWPTNSHSLTESPLPQ